MKTSDDERMKKKIQVLHQMFSLSLPPSLTDLRPEFTFYYLIVNIDRLREKVIVAGKRREKTSGSIVSVR